MDSQRKIEFKCRECGSSELGYQKYVKCLTPVSIKDNGPMEYGLSEIDEDDSLSAEHGFVCMNCKCRVEHCGFQFETEQQLFYYLEIGPEDRARQHQDYLDTLKARREDIPEFDDELFDLI